MTTKQIKNIIDETIAEYESKKGNERKISFFNSIMIALIPIFIVSALGAFTGVKVLDAVQDNKIQNNTEDISEIKKTSDNNFNEIFRINGRVSHIEGKLGINGSGTRSAKNTKDSK